MKIKTTYCFLIRRLIFCMLMAVGFFTPQFSSAQTDTLQYTEETAQDSMVQYLTPLEYAFMMHEETPWMVKANVLITNSVYNYLKIKMSFERKIAKSFSLNTSLQYFTSERLLDESFIVNAFSLFLEPRWYYNMTKKVKEGKSARNLSGNYFSIGAAYTLAKGNSTDNILSDDFVSLVAKWGIQHRFLKRGYIDFGIRSNVNLYTYHNLPTSFQISTFIDAGFAIAKDKQKFNKEGLCSVLRCYGADRFLLKTNLINLLSVGVSNNKFSLLFNPEISAEFKLGVSPFSINTNLKLESAYQDNNFFNFRAKGILEGRWYYNLNKRILKGKTGNGLSANYIALGSSYNFRYFNYRVNDEVKNGTSNLLDFRLVTGIQRTYSEHFYFDINLGIQYQRTLYGEPYFGEKYNFDAAGLLAIGYRF